MAKAKLIKNDSRVIAGKQIFEQNKYIYVLLAVLAVVIVPGVIGYIKCLMFLAGMGVGLLPFEVYKNSHIYLSGFTILLLGSVAPLSACFIGYWANELGYKKWRFYLLVLLTYSVLIGLYLLSFSLRVMPQSSSFLITEILFISASYFLGVGWKGLKYLDDTRYIILGSFLFLSVFFVMISGVNSENKLIRGGSSTTAFSFNPGLVGLLYTLMPISEISEVADDSVQGVYKTYGFLVNAHQYNFYFKPAIHDNTPNLKLIGRKTCIIPEQTVVLFIQGPDSAEGIPLGYKHREFSYANKKGIR